MKKTQEDGLRKEPTDHQRFEAGMHAIFNTTKKESDALLARDAEARKLKREQPKK